MWAAWASQGMKIRDTETLQYELVRVEYNIKIEAQRIQSAGLPKMLSDRLFLGI
jgi:hypothetical protein